MAEQYAPCPTCKQYSHSIGGDAVAEAFNHFQMMYAHPVRGHPMGYIYEAQTRDAAQVLVARITALEKALESTIAAFDRAFPPEPYEQEPEFLANARKALKGDGD